MKTHEEKTLKFPPLTDLRSISRKPKRCRTTVSIRHNAWEQRVTKWLVFGACDVRPETSSGRHGRFQLDAYMPEGVTDVEHDSARLLRLQLVGVQFEPLMVYNHTLLLTGWIEPDEEEAEQAFRVPGPGYNPMKAPKACTCKQRGCEKSHVVVPEGFYVPPFNADLYRLVQGRQVEILIGPTWEK